MTKQYYVYKVTDNKMNKFYIGARGTNNILEDDIGKVYFTSSTNKDFVNRMKINPTDFTFKVIKEFTDWNDALEYEYKLLKKFKANTNEHMYNKAITPSNKFSENFRVFDKLQNEWICVNSETYQQDRERYTHSCEGFVSCKNKNTGESCRVTVEEFWSNSNLEHATKNRKISKEEKQKRSVLFSGENNPFYEKTHTKESMNQMVSNRLKSGNGDYHHGKNPLKNIDVQIKCRQSRKDDGNWHGKCFSYKKKEYESVPQFLNDFPNISPKKFRRLLKDNDDKINHKLITLFLWLDSLENIMDETKNKKWLYRDEVETKYGVVRVYKYWNSVKRSIEWDK